MYLIDTHVIIWILYDSAVIPEKVKSILDNEKCTFSVASLWELAIKSGLGKIRLDQSIKEISDELLNAGFELRTITPEDCDAVKNLQLIHKDPFDRLIIAQAQTDHSVIVTKDETIPKYDVQTVWA